MFRNRLHHRIAAGLVATVGLLIALAVQVGATAAVSPPAAGSRLAVNAAQASPKLAFAYKAGFVVACRFSHRNQDDAIVYRRRPGRSHDHTYFGNRSTNAFSTPASLRKHRRTTCRDRDDRSAYWAPTLFVGGRAVTKVDLIAQYVRRTNARVEPFPAGLKMIAGDANARSPQASRVTSWSCALANWLEPAREDRVLKRGARRIPNCDDVLEAGRAVPMSLRLQINFPNCWNGQQLDSSNHKSHMAYSSSGACPRSHPVEVPALRLFIYYDDSGATSSEFASGGQFSAHADFVNAWNQARLRTSVNGYLNRSFG